MMNTALRRRLAGFLGATIFGCASLPTQAEELIGYTHDRRTLLFFDVDDAAA